MNPISLKEHFTFVFFIIPLLFSLKASAQRGEPIKSDLGEVITLYSDILKEDRKIMIYTQKDSSNLEKAYPVIYVLDADNHFSQMVEYSKLFGRKDVDVAPPLIVVGITNTDRTRDLTPTHSNFDSSGKLDTAAFKTSGGNDRFFKFIQKELMPYVNLHYKTQPYRILAGHSFGGITTINCLINYPDLFDAYIAVSPSLWWDQKFLLKVANKELMEGKVLSKTLFFSDGNEGALYKSSFHTDVLKFDSLLRKRNIERLDFQYVHYPAEDHNTVPFKSYFDGLRFIYRQWELPPVNDEEINSEIIMRHYQSLSKKFGYTILPEEADFNDRGEWLISQNSTLTNGINILEMNTINYPSSSKAFAALGAAYVKIGEKQKAIAAYKKAGELNPLSNEIKSLLQDLEK